MSQEREVAEEQQHLDRAHAALDVMREEARSMLGDVLDIGRGGTFQHRTERDIVVNTALSRLQQLDIGDQALCFGRIDTAGTSDGGGHESFHIGRVAVSGEGLEPLVVDWRAPIAEPFYRATGVEPLGLARRRHLQVRHREVLGVEDEYFTQADGTGPDLVQVERATKDGLVENGLALGGPGALLAALGQARTGQMGDIVATIQREQDEIIRSPLPGLLMVQGGPGTGKTAVALHRAAYLLYTHRFPLERQGVLVVGPNPLFLRYIEQVLPSLGEAGVTLSTVAGLVSEIHVRATEDDDVAELKGDARMARVVARAVRTRQRALPRDVSIPFGVAVLTLSVAMSEDVVARARRRPGPHNQRHRFVERELAALLATQYRRRVYGNVEREEGDDLEDQLRKTEEFRGALRRIWPRLAPHELIHDLLGALPLLRAAGAGLLADHEVEALHRPRSASLDEVAWTAADAGARRRGPHGPRGHPDRSSRGAHERRARAVRPGRTRRAGRRRRGHPQLRTHRRRRGPGPLRDAAAHARAPLDLRLDDGGRRHGPVHGARRDGVLGRRRHASRPAQAARHRRADRELPDAEGGARRGGRRAGGGRAVPPPSSAGAHDRDVPGPPRRAPRRTCSTRSSPRRPGASSRPSRPGAWRCSSRPRSSTRSSCGCARRALHAADPRLASGEGLAASLVVLPADDANGLEFDSVVVVEPSRIAERGGHGRAPTLRGLRSLYVAMTRPTRRLTVLGTSPLPTTDAPVGPAQMWHAEAAIN